MRFQSFFMLMTVQMNPCVKLKLYLMRKFEFPVAPMVLVTVLAKLMETSFIQSLVMSEGSPLIFLTRPIAIGFILLTAVSVLTGILLQKKAKAMQVELEESDS